VLPMSPWRRKLSCFARNISRHRDKGLPVSPERGMLVLPQSVRQARVVPLLYDDDDNREGGPKARRGAFSFERSL
jgi:hypothetical protein